MHFKKWSTLCELKKKKRKKEKKEEEEGKEKKKVNGWWGSGIYIAVSVPNHLPAEMDTKRSLVVHWATSRWNFAISLVHEESKDTKYATWLSVGCAVWPHRSESQWCDGTVTNYKQRQFTTSSLQGGRVPESDVWSVRRPLERETPLINEDIALIRRSELVWLHSSGAVWESMWPSWAIRPNEPSGFRGRKAILNHASAVSACP